MESRIRSLQGNGRPLPESVRSYFEPRFGHNFGEVQVHTDSRAADTARAVNAKAFTLGKDIVFGEREYAPGTNSGRQLLAHELTHVIQQNGAQSGSEHAPRRNPLAGSVPAGVLQRHNGDDSDAGVPDTDKPLTTAYGVSLVGEDGVQFSGLVFRPDAAGLRRLIEEYAAEHGSEAASDLVANLESSASSISADKSSMSGVTPEYELYASLDGRLDIIVPMAGEALAAVQDARRAFISDFETQAKANVLATLETSEETAKREAVRYGITETRSLAIEDAYACAKAGMCEPKKIDYHMQTGTPVAAGLQAAAKILIRRREEIAQLEREQWSATTCEPIPGEAKGCMYVPDEPRYSEIGQQIQAKREDYQRIRSALAAEYPVLAAVSEADKSTAALETIAKKGAGDETAQIIGAQIAERLANIAKVRANLDDKSEVNVWRLPPLVETTGTQLGAHTDALKKRWVSEQVEEEKPGLLGKIALLIFNLLAIALAPATGGVSLAVAAGVNVVATAVEVQEYMMQKALSRTDFDKAKSLSQEEPSLFWLAVSIVGTAVDVAGAAGALLKTFRTLAPLAKAAEAAKGGKEAEEAMEALSIAARKAGGPELAERVAANIRLARGGEAVALKAAGATEEELKMLQTALKAGETEAAETLGRTVVRTASSEVKCSKAGHLFSCSSACTMLREKYAAALAKEPALETELAALEKRALDAAAEVKRGGPKAEELAEAVKRDAAAFETKLRKAHPDLVPVSAVEDPGAVQQIKTVEAEAAEAGKRIKPAEFTPPPPRRPESIKPDDPLWNDYESYYATRYSAIKAEEKAGAVATKYPLEWAEYQSFLSKFRRGTAFQKKVTETLTEEAKKAEGLVGKMEDPLVLENVGVAGKPAGASTKYVDQLIVDKASIGPGKTPNVQAFSNKSREFPAKLDSAARGAVREQVGADAREALTKYGGEITIRRPEHPLFEETVRVSRVMLIYDKAFVKSPTLEALIRSAASGIKVEGQSVTVLFL